MIGCSRCSGRSTLRFLSLFLLACVILTTTGCSRTQPRQHWWEFWKPKAATTDSVYHPDTEVLPPPPGAADRGGPNAGTSIGNDLPPPPTAVDAARIPVPDPIRQASRPISELHNIAFLYDSSDLSAESQRLLDENAAWLRNRPNFEVSIDGHCDERGTAEYNMNLGMRRAKVVRDYLVSKGVDASRLHPNSYGEERPLDPGQSEDAYAKNRRVQFLVY